VILHIDIPRHAIVGIAAGNKRDISEWKGGLTVKIARHQIVYVAKRNWLESKLPIGASARRRFGERRPHIVFDVGRNLRWNW
jgi:hypothetical protein